MSDLLVVTGNGRLGKDAELKYTNNGKAYLNFSVAASTGWGDKKTTNWIECTIWGQQAERLVQYLVKGKQVAFTGEMTIDKWESNGRSGTTVRCSIDHVALINDGTAQSGAARQDDQSREPRRPQQGGQQGYQQQGGGFQPPGGGGFRPPAPQGQQGRQGQQGNDFTDDIPF